VTTADAVALLERLLPVVVFLLAITVVAEVAERAGVFDVAGHWVAHAGRHRAWALWLLFALLAVGCTVVLSLDFVPNAVHALRSWRSDAPEGSSVSERGIGSV